MPIEDFQVFGQRILTRPGASKNIPLECTRKINLQSFRAFTPNFHIKRDQNLQGQFPLSRWLAAYQGSIPACLSNANNCSTSLRF
jgi:hypothetical protein